MSEQTAAKEEVMTTRLWIGELEGFGYG